MAYFYILLSAGCSLMIVHFLKASEVEKNRTLNTLTVNYLIAAIVAFGTGFAKAGTVTLPLQWLIMIFCLVVGAFFIANFIAYSKSVHLNGMGVTVTAMRLSLLFPVLLSVFYYGEYIGWIKTAGIILVFGSLVLLVPKNNSSRIGNIHAGWLLVIIFAMTGVADASLKVYKEEFSLQLNELQFMGIIFSAAFLIGLVMCLVRKGPVFNGKEIKMGILIGLPNLYSSVFLIYALSDIDGSIAFPLVNIISVGAGTALGMLYWKDKVSSRQWVGLAIAIISIIILL